MLQSQLQPVRFLLQLGLVILLGWQGAQLTWQSLTPVATPSAWQATARTTSTTASSVRLFTVEPLQRLSLFGQVTKVAEPAKPAAVVEAPVTRLNLKLLGVMAVADGLGGVAIIESSGQQDVYIVGESLAGGQATLHQILSDRVLIERSGQLEILMLQGEDASSSSSATASRPAAATADEPSRREIDKRDDQVLIDQLAARREELTSIEGISKYLRVAPVQGSDGLRGYRLRPGGSAELFRQMGLQSGDIATTINGYDLTDQSQAMQALAELTSVQEASVTVERQGQLVDLFFSLPQ